MIHDSLSNTAVVEKLHPLFKKAFDYIKSKDFTKVDPCKMELDGQSLIMIISEATGKPAEEIRSETHQKHIDIQIPIMGTEIMGWLSSEHCNNPLDPYNSEKDVTLFSDMPTSYVQVQSGEFVIFYPEDGHAPGIGEGFIKKVIFKVLI